MKWRALLVLALLASTPAMASAEVAVQLGFVATMPDGFQSDKMAGIGMTAVFGSANWFSFPLRADVAGSSEDWLGLATVGVRVGTTQGVARPYFEAFFGVTPGTASYAGLATGYSAGGTLEISEALGFFIDVGSVSSGNFEYDGHFVQARAGLQWRTMRRR
jgi:hypothetical protein